MLDETWAVTTQGIAASSSGDADPQWPACLACAVVDRARNRTGVAREGTCQSCFDRYCWSEDSSSSSKGKNGAAGNIGKVGSWATGLGAVVAGLMLLL